ncbi:MAG: hypothetical protein V4672_13145 [Verrucomicrobiota bacterium]
MVASFLGKQESDLPAVIESDGLPAVPICTGSRPATRIYFLPLLEWINKRVRNSPMTAEHLEAELERCSEVLKTKDAKKRNKQKTKAQA